MSDILELGISILCLFLAGFLGFLMITGQSLITKNNNIYMEEGEVEKPEKYHLKHLLALILFVMLIVLLVVSIIADASDLNITNTSTSTSSVMISDGEIKVISDSRINLNTATKDELMSLDGIGEVKATRIIEYRNKHPFNSITELLNVIGTQTYDTIKNDVTTDN